MSLGFTKIFGSSYEVSDGEVNPLSLNVLGCYVVDDFAGGWGIEEFRDFAGDNVECLVDVVTVTGVLDVVPELLRVCVRSVFFGVSDEVSYVFNFADEFLSGSVANGGGGL